MLTRTGDGCPRPSWRRPPRTATQEGGGTDPGVADAFARASESPGEVEHIDKADDLLRIAAVLVEHLLRRRHDPPRRVLDVRVQRRRSGDHGSDGIGFDDHAWRVEVTEALYAAAFDEEAGRYVDLVGGEHPSLLLDAAALVVKPEAACVQTPIALRVMPRGRRNHRQRW